ncbi:MAG TPA: hypothetical protein VGE74_14395 [Gemmata sp.]
MPRAFRIGFAALVLLAVAVPPARADVAPFVPSPKPAPPVDPLTGKPLPEVREEKKPRRNGPFRSCGSGAGTGLAAIGASWAVLWIGTRVAGHVRRTKAPGAR